MIVKKNGKSKHPKDGEEYLLRGERMIQIKGVIETSTALTIGRRDYRYDVPGSKIWRRHPESNEEYAIETMKTIGSLLIQRQSIQKQLLKEVIKNGNSWFNL